MHSFSYRKNELHCEQASVKELAERHGTPLYVYSQETLARRFQDLEAALQPLDHRICYAVKANSNLAVLRVLARLGAGFDIVSEGELRRVIAAGGDPARCVFAGVGKTEREIEFALRRGIYCLNVESEAELARINKVAARLGKIAPVAVRVNPNIDAHTHAKITTGTYENKFGIQFEQVEGGYARARRLRNLARPTPQFPGMSQPRCSAPAPREFRREWNSARRSGSISSAASPGCLTPPKPGLRSS